MNEKKKGEIEIEDELDRFIKLDYSELVELLQNHDRLIARTSDWNSHQATQIEELEEQVKELTERFNKLVVRLGNAGDLIG